MTTWATRARWLAAPERADLAAATGAGIFDTADPEWGQLIGTDSPRRTIVRKGALP
jgi:hypothetical protein